MCCASLPKKFRRSINRRLCTKHAAFLANWQPGRKEALIKGDSALFLNCYTPDACVLAPNTPQLCGQQGVSRFFKGVRFQAGIRDASFTHIGLYGQTPEYVTQQGAFEVFNEAQHSLGKGKVLIIWKKTAEGWKMFRHSLNFDAPMPAPPASSPE
jgi:ketosteroid isomerase-like protein